MNTKILTFLGYSLLLATSIVGVVAANRILADYKVIVDGILGLVVSYLFYRVFISSKRLEFGGIDPSKALFVFPANIKLFILVFWWSMVIYWAISGVYFAVLFLIDK